LFAGQDKLVAFPEVRPDDAAQVQYTSGTTGFPKGAVLHHRGLTNNSRMIFKRLGVREGDAMINFMPMFHTSGCAINTLGSAQLGCSMIICKLFEPNRVLDVMEEECVAVLLGVPTMMVGMLEAQTAKARDLSAVRIAVSGGSMVPPELVRRVRSVFGCDFETVYGQTETSPVLTQTRADDSIEDLCETVGQALPLIEMSIRDPRSNAVAAIGAVGEICSRGYCNMIGYNDNPEATKATVDSEGWLHTGDLGTMDERGFVKVTGRVKEMIIRGGENLFPAEIENVLLEHPSVAECAVVGVPDERWGEIVTCFVRLNAGATLDRSALVAHCRQHLSAPKTPAHWFEVTSWPLTGSGKIQKFVLRDRVTSGEIPLD
jgi:fatty-acyl-CoA synthase